MLAGVIRMLVRRASFFAIALTSSALYLAPTQASEAEVKAAIGKLLEVGWAITPQARTAADAHYLAATQIAGNDPRALAAYSLVLLYQHRYEDALKRLNEQLARSPGDLEALRAKAMVLTILKSYPAAMLAADQLSAAAAAEPRESASANPSQRDSIAFLGRLVGFLGGPVSEAVNQDERMALEKKLLARLDEAGVIVFEDARNGVLDKFIEMSDNQADARERAVADATADKEKTLTDVQAEREKIAARNKELADRKSKIRDQFQEELDDIAKKDQPLVQDLARLNARSNSLNGTLFAYEGEINRLQQLANSEKSNARKQQLLNQANQLAIAAAQINADLIGTNTLLQGVQNQRVALANRQAQAQASAQSQVNRIDKELEGLGKRDRRNEGIGKRTARPVSASTGKVRSLSAQATAFTTYEAFPLEAAKVRLLEALR